MTPGYIKLTIKATHDVLFKREHSIHVIIVKPKHLKIAQHAVDIVVKKKKKKKTRVEFFIC